MEPLRLALIGCGEIVRAHLWGLRCLAALGLEDVRVVAVCDLDRERARAVAGSQLRTVRPADAPDAPPHLRRYDGCQLGAGDLLESASRPDVHTDWRTVLARDDLDAVFVLTPPALHGPLVVACAAAGRHVFVEKPLALDVAGARAAVQACAAADVRLCVGHNYRFDPATVAARWLLTSGRLGVPRVFSWVTLRGPGHWTGVGRGLVGRLLGRVRDQLLFYRPATLTAPAGPAWRYDALSAGSGPVVENGSHILDTARHVMGPIRSVSAHVERLGDDRVRTSDRGTVRSEVPDTLIALLRFADGGLGQLGLSTATPGDPLGGREGFLVHAERGSVSTDAYRLPDGRSGDPWALYREGAGADRVQADFPGGLTHRFALQQLDFLRAVRGGSAPRVDGAEGLAAVAAAQAAVRSSAIGAEVRLDAPGSTTDPEVATSHRAVAAP